MVCVCVIDCMWWLPAACTHTDVHTHTAHVSCAPHATTFVSVCACRCISCGCRCCCCSLVAYVKAAVRSFVSREVHVRASVARRFYWSELNLWPEDLPPGSTILLSGKASWGFGAASRFLWQAVEPRTHAVSGCTCIYMQSTERTGSAQLAGVRVHVYLDCADTVRCLVCTHV